MTVSVLFLLKVFGYHHSINRQILSVMVLRCPAPPFAFHEVRAFHAQSSGSILSVREGRGFSGWKGSGNVAGIWMGYAIEIGRKLSRNGDVENARKKILSHLVSA